MANEAVITTLLGNAGDPVEYTIANGTAGSDIALGTLMKISASPKTIAAAGADGEFFAGILSAEHVGGKGTTKATVITHCIAEMTAGTGATTFGQPQKISGANLVIDADDDGIAKAAEVVGLSLETVADGDRGAVLVNR